MRPAAFSFAIFICLFLLSRHTCAGIFCFDLESGEVCCAKRWTVAFLSLPGGKLQKKKKRYQGKSLIPFGAEGETRQGAALSVRCANDPIVCPFLLRKKMDGSVLVSPGWEVANKKKRYQGKSLIPFGAEGETRQGAALSVRCANDPILCPFLLRKKMDGSVLVSPGWEVANKKKRH